MSDMTTPPPEDGDVAPAASPAAPPPPPPPATTGNSDFGPPGAIRGPLFVILIGIVTLGIYWIYWWYKVFQEMKDHNREGLGGGAALAMAIVGYLICPILPIIMAFLLANEIANMYRRAGQKEPVSAIWGLWFILPLIGQIIWLVKVQHAMNDRWASLGVVKT